MVNVQYIRCFFLITYCYYKKNFIKKITKKPDLRHYYVYTKLIMRLQGLFGLPITVLWWPLIRVFCRIRILNKI